MNNADLEYAYTDHKYENNINIICPYCDEEHVITIWTNSNNTDMGIYIQDGRQETMHCHNCDNEFNVEVTITVTYTSSK